VLIPVRIYVDYREDYPVTLALIGMNLVAFLPVLFSSCASCGSIFSTYGLIAGSPRPHQFVTHMFLHGGIMHFAFNMLFLWLFGKVVESIFGHGRFLLFYFGGGIAAALTQLAICHTSGVGLNIPMIGASGAIAAVLGVFLVRYYFVKIEMRWFFFFFLFFRIYTFHLRAWVFLLLLWFLPQLAFGLLTFNYISGVAYWAHIGGFLFGVVLGLQMNLLKEAQAEISYIKAQDSFLRGDESSHIHLRQSIETSPKNIKPRLELAQSYINERRLDEAVREYAEAFRLAYQTGDIEEALGIYDSASVLSPDELILSEEMEFEVGMQCIKYAHYETGFSIFEKLHRLRPEHSKAEQILAKLISLAANKLVRCEEAQKYFEELKNRYPESKYIAMLQWDVNKLKDQSEVLTSRISS
jgi:membrane associated rhomboid family serine protease